MTKHVIVQLTPEQRTHLTQLTRAGTSAARVQTRARILLSTARSQGEQRSDATIAAALGVSRSTIIRTRQRFVADGLEAALYDRPRPGALPKITGEVEAQLILLACSTPPAGKARWTLHMLADKLVELQLVDQISDVAVHYRLKKTRYGCRYTRTSTSVAEVVASCAGRSTISLKLEYTFSCSQLDHEVETL
jgi:transposase